MEYSLCGVAVDTTAMPCGAIPEVPGGGCPERGIGCPMAPRPPIPPRGCAGPRDGMPIPAAPAVGPPVRLCSAFIGSVGTQVYSISEACTNEAPREVKVKPFIRHRHDSLKVPQ